MWVFSNTAVSLDGRIGTVNDDQFCVGTDQDRRRMGLLRAKADVILIGGQTFRMGPHPIAAPPELSVAGARGPVINAVMTRSGIVDEMGDDWPDPNVDLHVFGPASLDAAGHEARGASVHVASDVVDVLSFLREKGCERVLVEGGGNLIFSLVAAGLLDTIFMTLAPRIIGGVGAPSLADGVGFSAGQIQDYRLTDCEHLGDELYLRYDRKR
jgi:2,5-diamino-6-(ribosylamino)-4(3H)-pyrimidinone 5'-phosphate reductase